MFWTVVLLSPLVLGSVSFLFESAEDFETNELFNLDETSVREGNLVLATNENQDSGYLTDSSCPGAFEVTLEFTNFSLLHFPESRLDQP